MGSQKTNHWTVKCTYSGKKLFKELRVMKKKLSFVWCFVPGARDSNSLYSEECAQIHGSQRLAMVEATCTCYATPQCTPDRGRTQSNQGKFEWDYLVLYRYLQASTGCYLRTEVSKLCWITQMWPSESS